MGQAQGGGGISPGSGSAQGGGEIESEDQDEAEGGGGLSPGTGQTGAQEGGGFNPQGTTEGAQDGGGGLNLNQNNSQEGDTNQAPTGGLDLGKSKTSAPTGGGLDVGPTEEATAAKSLPWGLIIGAALLVIIGLTTFFLNRRKN